MTLTKEQIAQGRTQAARKRLANKVAREVSKETLEGGAALYRDTPPGVGFVLEFPNRRKCYYATPDQAREMWVTKWMKDFGVKGSEVA